MTGAYECEEEYACGWILRIAKEFKTALEESDLKEQRGVPELLAALSLTIDFLESVPDEQASRRCPIPERTGFEDLEDLLESIPVEQVRLYSYDRAPSISELLDAWRKGNDVDDWAMEELEKKGDKGRRELLLVLKKEKNRARLLTALEVLIVFFRDDQTRTAVQRFIETSGDEIQQAAQAIAEQADRWRRPPPIDHSKSRSKSSQD